MDKVQLLRWGVRISSLSVLIFVIPFYASYGNPLPFIDPEYTLFDNIWLTVFPFVLLGFILSWRFEKSAGYLIVVPIVSGWILSFIVIGKGLPWLMLVPLAFGFLFLILSSEKKPKKK